MDAKERFRRAAAALAHEQLVATGWDHYFFDDFDQAQKEAGASDNEARLVVTAMEDEYLVTRGQGHFRATPHLALLHEQFVSEAAYAENRVRRAVLTETWRAESEGAQWGRFDESSAERLGYPIAQLRAAARVLDATGYVELKGETNGSFVCAMRSGGNGLMEDDALLRSTLPITVGDDEEVLPSVAPDVLKELILSCEQLLVAKGWENALDELHRGDDQYAKGEWVNAVREYYSSLESGFKYALHVEGDEADTNALKSLAKLAAERGLIPPNYQALFGFPSSIRSPRSHGAGPRPEEVEVNQPEALVMGNLTRSLLVYLASRAVGSA